MSFHTQRVVAPIIHFLLGINKAYLFGTGMGKAVFLGEGKFNWEPLDSVFFSIFRKRISPGAAKNPWNLLGEWGIALFFSGNWRQNIRDVSQNNFHWGASQNFLAGLLWRLALFFFSKDSLYFSNT